MKESDFWKREVSDQTRIEEMGELYFFLPFPRASPPITFLHHLSYLFPPPLSSP